MAKGKLIVMEGACDGIGKTTQYELLCKRLIEDGINIKNHHFPSYGTPQGEPVEKFLRGEFGDPSTLSPYFVNELYAEDRKVTWHDELKSFYEKGYTILLDRYTTSSIIYQSVFIEDICEKKKFIDYVINHEYKENAIKEPDLVIFIYVPFVIAKKMKENRIDNEGIVNDVFERDMNLMEKIYNNGVFVADYLNWDFIDCSKDGKLKTKEEIHEDIYRLVKTKKR